MTVKHVTVREAHQKLREGYTYLDVRSIPEFAQAHPAGAVNVPLLHRDPRSGQMLPNREFAEVIQSTFPRDARLLIGCQVGGRSVHAAEILAASGFSDVSNVLGGFGGARDPVTGAVQEGWVQAGLPTASEAEPGRSYGELRGRVRTGESRG